MSTSNKALSIAAALALLTSACGGGDDAAAFCDAAEALSGLDPTADVDLDSEDPGAAMAEAFSEFTDGIAALQESAPSEIEADLELIGDGMTTLSDALEEADGDFMALAFDPELAAQLEALDGPEFDQAATNIENYVSEECGFELDAE